MSTATEVHALIDRAAYLVHMHEKESRRTLSRAEVRAFLFEKMAEHPRGRIIEVANAV